VSGRGWVLLITCVASSTGWAALRRGAAVLASSHIKLTCITHRVTLTVGLHMHWMQLVVADKNLVPSPPGNIQRVVGILKDSGTYWVTTPGW
jgi:hypothetical protein